MRRGHPKNSTFRRGGAVLSGAMAGFPGCRGFVPGFAIRQLRPRRRIKFPKLRHTSEYYLKIYPLRPKKHLLTKNESWGLRFSCPSSFSGRGLTRSAKTLPRRRRFPPTRPKWRAGSAWPMAWTRLQPIRLVPALLSARQPVRTAPPWGGLSGGLGGSSDKFPGRRPTRRHGVLRGGRDRSWFGCSRGPGAGCVE